MNKLKGTGKITRVDVSMREDCHKKLRFLTRHHKKKSYSELIRWLVCKQYDTVKGND